VGPEKHLPKTGERLPHALLPAQVNFLLPLAEGAGGRQRSGREDPGADKPWEALDIYRSTARRRQERWLSTPPRGNRSRFLTIARRNPFRNAGGRPWKDQGGGGRRAPTAGCSMSLQGWGAAPSLLLLLLRGDPAALHRLPPPPARPPLRRGDERQGEAGRGEPRRGLTVRIGVFGGVPRGGEGWRVQQLAPAPLPLSLRGGTQPHACRGGRGQRLKATPSGPTPCARRSRRPRRSAPFVLPPSYGKTHMSRYGRDAPVSLAYL